MSGGGPQSEEGKSVSRWNAARHGLRSPAPVVPGLEHEEDWKAHRSGILESLSPQGHLEQVLAERVALQSWRLNRIVRYERENIALSREKMEEDVFAAQELSPAARRSGRMDGRAEPSNEDRGDLKSLRDTLESVPRVRRLLVANLELPVEEFVASSDAERLLHAVRAIACRNKPPARRTEIGVVTLPGASRPIDLEYPESFDNWNVRLVRQAVDAIAEHAKENTDELLEATKNRLEDVCRELEEKRHHLEKELERMSRERLLPNDKTLEKIARYEAHISRQMYQALHELEALQTRRAGRVASLGRLDVQGLPEE